MASMGGERKRVVVIGGGSGGSLAAKLLQDHADVVLIDTKEYFEITWANLRSMVEPSFAGRCIINHSEYLPNARVIVSAATDINGDEVVTAAGHRIPYDYLIIATGHLDPCALTRGERLNYFQSEYEKIISSNSILIVGGGPTGVELAGEIAVDFPEKKVTLVHRGTRLMEFVGPKASRKTLDWLTTKKVEVILGQSVNPTPVSDGVYETSGGETIRADCLFTCIGKPVGSSWLQSTMFKSSLDAKGRLMVEPNLRVKGYNNVFAIGDITDIPEIKQGYLANAHAELTAKNLKLLMAGGPESKMGTHKPGKALAFVSLGRNDAVAQILFITMIGCVPGKIKSKDLFVGKTRKQLGLKP
ncbi:uncharacterized protein LOC127797853 [Diospyros lotus]|uniref:uncharacterized protein LOC127797853 n=1 Tax=Diospyros lotus TaxID=55363 RepID=UPI00224FADF8|nr:uncharacterized protein LOC127797853 [Diospyros lotus]